MPKLSAFTPVGLLRMTSAPSQARIIFNAKASALGATGKRPAYASVAQGTRLGARIYAESIREAVIRMLIQRGADSDLPDKMHPVLFPIRELEYGITPGYGETLAQRRAALRAAYRLIGAGDRYNIENTLRALLGSGFVYYRTTKSTERVLYPTTCGASPMNFQLPTVQRVVIKIDPVNGVSLPGPSPQQVGYVPFIPESLPDGVPILQPGMALVVEPEIPARAERVTVIATGVTNNVPWFQAVFNNAHEPGAAATSGPLPFWVASQRYAIIVVTAAVAADQNLVRQIHQIMRTLARGVSTWAIAAQSGPGTAGPFYINTSLLGSTCLGTITFP